MVLTVSTREIEIRGGVADLQGLHVGRVAIDEPGGIGGRDGKDGGKGRQEGKQAFHGDRRSLTYPAEPSSRKCLPEAVRPWPEGGRGLWLPRRHHEQRPLLHRKERDLQEMLGQFIGGLPRHVHRPGGLLVS